MLTKVMKLYSNSFLRQQIIQLDEYLMAPANATVDF